MAYICRAGVLSGAASREAARHLWERESLEVFVRLGYVFGFRRRLTQFACRSERGWGSKNDECIREDLRDGLLRDAHGAADPSLGRDLYELEVCRSQNDTNPMLTGTRAGRVVTNAVGGDEPASLVRGG